VIGLHSCIKEVLGGQEASKTAGREARATVLGFSCEIQADMLRKHEILPSVLIGHGFSRADKVN
jgi:hypothetical protein